MKFPSAHYDTITGKTRSLPDEVAVFIVGGGTITALAGGPLSLADMGPRKTRRVSHIEFCEITNEWLVTDLKTDRVIFRSGDYDVALAWERTIFNRRLAAPH